MLNAAQAMRNRKKIAHASIWEPIEYIRGNLISEKRKSQDSNQYRYFGYGVV